MPLEPEGGMLAHAVVLPGPTRPCLILDLSSSVLPRARARGKMPRCYGGFGIEGHAYALAKRMGAMYIPSGPAF